MRAGLGGSFLASLCRPRSCWIVRQQTEARHAPGEFEARNEEIRWGCRPGFRDGLDRCRADGRRGEAPRFGVSIAIELDEAGVRIGDNGNGGEDVLDSIGIVRAMKG